MKRDLIKKVVAVALDNGLIEKGNLDISERQDEVTDIISSKMHEYMKNDIEAELMAYGEELQNDLHERGLNDKEIGAFYAGFMATYTNIMDILEQ